MSDLSVFKINLKYIYKNQIFINILYLINIYLKLKI